MGVLTRLFWRLPTMRRIPQRAPKKASKTVYLISGPMQTSLSWVFSFFLNMTNTRGKIFFWHYSIKIIGNFLICFLLLNWFFSIKFYQIFSNRKMSIINRKISIKFQNIRQNAICYKGLCCQKVKVQNWSSLFSNRKMSIINRKNSIKIQNIWHNSICCLCFQKVKVQN